MVQQDKKWEALLAKHNLLDGSCKEIFAVLITYKSLRHDSLLRTLKKFDFKMTRPTLDVHLRHLLDSGLIVCEKDFQYASYEVTQEIYELLRPLNRQEIKKWLELRNKSMPSYLQSLKMSTDNIVRRMSDEQLDRMIIADLNAFLGRSLHEIKTFIEYDLRLDKFDSDEAFWKLVGNPLYRMHEKSLAERCRDSSRYREKLFSRIEVLKKEFSSE